MSDQTSTTGQAGDEAGPETAITTAGSTTTALHLAHNSTILPTRIANLISALASSTRLSLSVVASFIETILESFQFSTRISLGYTRKLLISAITSARCVYLLSNAALSGNILTLLDFKDDTHQSTPRTDAFLQVLDRYTNLGIYVIHHTFTLAELFTMSGFYLAGSAVSSGIAAARESVGILDSIFGSNESSRALASIITLVRREVMLDERSRGEGKRGVVKTLGGLTKAMTAFACLQNATWAQTLSKIRMKVIHDCTVYPGRRKEIGANSMETLDRIDDTRQGQAIAGPGPSTMVSRQASPTPHHRTSLPTDTDDTAPLQELDKLADELEELLGRDDILEVTDEITESIVITQILEKAQAGQNLRGEYPDRSEEEEWIEVDNLLDGDTHQPPIRPISLNEATDHPRLQLVLKNITKRIMTRRRTFRRVRHEDEQEEEMGPIVPPSTPHRSPGSVTSPKSSPSKRSSPFKVLVQAKSAVARRLRFRSGPSTESSPKSPGNDIEAGSDHDVPPDTSSDTTSFLPAEETIENEAELPKDELPALLFPHDSLIANIHRFMRYSSAAYGQHFLRILGLGNREYNFPSTSQHHFNSWAFAQHTNLAIDSLLHTSHTASSSNDGALPLVHYVSVDHNLKAIVLTCRGTLGLSDVLIDLTCDYQDITLDNPDPDARYYVHKGMYQSAKNLTTRNSTVHQGLVDALTRYPEYGLVVCGHSLGGGVAAAFAILSATPSAAFELGNNERAAPVTHPAITTPFVTSFSSGLPPGRPIHAYAYGPPALASPDLARYAQGLITSVVLNKDIVPCLSLGLLRDLKNIALTLREEDRVAEEIVGRVAGLYKRRFGLGNRNPPSGTAPPEEAVLSDWLVSLINTMRADMDNDKLYPPGCVYIMEYYEVFNTQSLSLVPKGDHVTQDRVYRALLHRCESVELRFREPIFTKSMLHDHLPSGYERATQLLYDGIDENNVAIA